MAEESAGQRPVFVDGSYTPFGELTAAQASARADDLRQAAGLGHGSRVGSVAAGWRELAMELDRRGVATVGGLDPATMRAFAERLWVVAPDGGLLSGGADEPGDR